MTDGGLTLYDLFARTALRHPDAIALEVDGAAHSYRDLARLVDRCAGRLTATLDRVPSRIGLLASRSVEAYVGYLAVLRLGAAVVPLNPLYPPARNAAIATGAGLDLVLTDGVVAEETGQALGAVTVRQIGADDNCATAPGAAGTGPDDVAYVLFTSGSTGRPKGVPIRHRNVVPFVLHNVTRYDVGPGARLSQTFELTFDLSVFDLFVTWAGGGTLVVPDKLELLAPVDYVNDRQLTHWFSVPSVVSYAAELDSLPPGSMPGLRFSLFCGEQLTRAQCAMWAGAAVNSTVENLYGPTELTIACAAYRVPQAAGQPRTSNGTVPIGEPYPYLESVLVADGLVHETEGELCVRGPQRFAGYLCPDDNRDRFLLVVDGRTRPVAAGAAEVPSDAWYRTGDLVRYEDGRAVHLGRLDDQVKVRGHRVELGEIVAAVRNHPGVRDCVVVARPDPLLGTELVAAHTGEPIDEAELCAVVRRTLPPYMTPARFVHLERFPLNANGKIERAAVLAMVDRDRDRSTG
ncbi:amino acid adenylation domain-containing protein [Micromonospora sp. R77]|uniref:amino acid adenylation domain-containing protein n=1 Tax=Micromonospora sp. R77 TaxID=2925836 RepID=UPI001F619850|nr:amino acid adenylation domain-containing protein [Micromonospora sp. R77]MCI4066802.1 amino acid adenylation domain-containing protein [Micromonospora sp. R77]